MRLCIFRIHGIEREVGRPRKHNGVERAFFGQPRLFEAFFEEFADALRLLRARLDLFHEFFAQRQDPEIKAAKPFPVLMRKVADLRARAADVQQDRPALRFAVGTVCDVVAVRLRFAVDEVQRDPRCGKDLFVHLFDVEHGAERRRRNEIEHIHADAAAFFLHGEHRLDQLFDAAAGKRVPVHVVQQGQAFTRTEKRFAPLIVRRRQRDAARTDVYDCIFHIIRPPARAERAGTKFSDCPPLICRSRRPSPRRRARSRRSGRRICTCPQCRAAR